MAFDDLKYIEDDLFDSSFKFGSVPINLVMANIEKYVIKENRRAIEYLWDKNILTTQTNNYDNEESWIAFGELSDENLEIVMREINTSVSYGGIPRFAFNHGKAIEIPTKPGTKDTFEDFKYLIDKLEDQDVQKDGYMTIDEFYIDCMGFYKLTNNPFYHPLIEPKRKDYSTEEMYRKALNFYLNEPVLLRKIKVVDESKIARPLEEYLKEKGLYYDSDEKKIFYNKRLYDGHMRYKQKHKSKK